MAGQSEARPLWAESPFSFTGRLGVRVWRSTLSVSARFRQHNPSASLVWFGEPGKEALLNPLLFRRLLLRHWTPSSLNPYPESAPEHWNWHPAGYIGQLFEAVLDPVALLDPENPPQLSDSESWLRPPELELPFRPPSRAESLSASSSDIRLASEKRECAMAALQLLFHVRADFNGVFKYFSEDDVHQVCSEAYVHGWGESLGFDSNVAVAHLLSKKLVPSFFGMGLLVYRKMIEKKRQSTENPAPPEEPRKSLAPPLNVSEWRARRAAAKDTS